MSHARHPGRPHPLPSPGLSTSRNETHDRRRPARPRRHPARRRGPCPRRQEPGPQGDGRRAARRRPSLLRNVPRHQRRRVVRGLLELHGVTVAPGEEPGELVLDPSHGGARQRRRHRRARRLQPHPDPASAARCCTGSATPSSPTSAAAASATGRSTSTSTRCARSARSSTSAPRACTSTAPHRLRGTKIQLPYPSVGATEQVLLTAVLAEGVTELRNAAIEPEIMDLIAVLQKMGAIISVRHRPGDPDHRRGPARRLQPPGAAGPARGGVLGLRRAGHRRRHLRPRAPAGAR